ncbi:MAG: aminotransferase class IV [Micrococcus sp.]|nr:aminotransferase class IV [Micrococcus sp.]
MTDSAPAPTPSAAMSADPGPATESVPAADVVPDADPAATVGRAAAPVLVLWEHGADPGTPRLADPFAPQLTVTDQGATRGDGLFETALAVPATDGTLRPRKLEAHLERLAASADALSLDVPEPAQWRSAIELALREYGACHPGEGAVLRLSATRGPDPTLLAPGEQPHSTCWVLVSALPAPRPELRERGVSVLVLERGLDSRVTARAPWLLTGAKTLSYAINMAALRHARAQGADDAIFVSADGQLLEGPTSTILLVRTEDDGTRRLITPLRQQGILAGTSQAVIFAAAAQDGWELGYGPLVTEDLTTVDGIWLVSSVRGVVPVRAVSGLGIDRPELAIDAELTATLEDYLRADLPAGEHGPTHAPRS